MLGVITMYWVVYLFVQGRSPAEAETPFWIVGFAFGACFVALFAQLGGGIYTKAADVGADLVGKVEAGIPEDDPRNPAVIADLVGDNVGDCAGRGADIFESSAAEIIGAMILGVALFKASGLADASRLDLLSRSCSARSGRSLDGRCPLGSSGQDAEEPDGRVEQRLLRRPRRWRSSVSSSSTTGCCRTARSSISLCGLIGIAHVVRLPLDHPVLHERPLPSGQGDHRSLPHRPRDEHHLRHLGRVRNHRRPALTIAAALLGSYFLGDRVDFPVDTRFVRSGGIFGTAVATMGMLMSAAYILAMDTFGPITDNAGGIVEMSDQPERVRDTTDALDSAGNTTKALTKGYAIGTAALAAFLLFSAFLQEVARFGGTSLQSQVVDLANPRSSSAA